MTVSKAQLRWANSPAGKQALTPKQRAEFNASAKGKRLPERVKATKK